MSSSGLPLESFDPLSVPRTRLRPLSSLHRTQPSSTPTKRVPRSRGAASSSASSVRHSPHKSISCHQAIKPSLELLAMIRAARLACLLALLPATSGFSPPSLQSRHVACPPSFASAKASGRSPVCNGVDFNDVRGNGRSGRLHMSEAEAAAVPPKKGFVDKVRRFMNCSVLCANRPAISAGQWRLLAVRCYAPLQTHLTSHHITCT